MSGKSRGEPLAPLVEPLPNHLDAPTAFRRLSSWPNLIWFDSARPHETLGRYSYISLLPCSWYEYASPHMGRRPNSANDAAKASKSANTSASPAPSPLADLTDLMQKFGVERSAVVPGLPPFQGGLAGLLGYDLGSLFEPNRIVVRDSFHVPAVCVGLYPTVLAFDHATKQGWIISHGWSRGARSKFNDVAAQRLKIFKQLLGLESPSGSIDFMTQGPKPPVPAHDLAPLQPLPGARGLFSNFSRAEYERSVQRAIDYIHAGDVFQVNLAQRLLAPGAANPTELYLRLREKNPAPFAGYFDTGEFQIASASPERFLQVLDRKVETRPIKGTRQRALMPEADLFSGDELLTNEKDRAENVMIVDLLRNDLSRVCTPESVRVTRLCGLEQYQYVQHLTSVIEGRLLDDRQPLDLIGAAFPGGSITGAPKPRAMEIIAELEGVARGAYCGSLMYLGHDGSFDSSILIRTITAGAGWLQAHVGGGIVADSQPAAEYDETMHKAQGLAQVMLAEKGAS